MSRKIGVPAQRRNVRVVIALVEVLIPDQPDDVGVFAALKRCQLMANPAILRMERRDRLALDRAKGIAITNAPTLRRHRTPRLRGYHDRRR